MNLHFNYCLNTSPVLFEAFSSFGIVHYNTLFQLVLMVMCRNVEQASHSILLPHTHQWWYLVLNCNNWLKLHENAQMLNFAWRRCKREWSNTRGVNCTVCWTHGDIWTIHMYIYILHSNLRTLDWVSNVHNSVPLLACILYISLRCI